MIVERQFKLLLSFYFPDLHTAIDWSVEPKFLDQEFQKIIGDNETSDRRVDKLVSVRLKDGTDVWLLIHIEVQNAPDDQFDRRMFIYFYRIYDKYERYPVSLAILTDEDGEWRPTQHQHTHFGCTITLDFPTIKLLDYDQNALLESDNPFAFVTLAHLQTMEAGRSDNRRMDTKYRLMKLLFEQGYGKQEIRDLFLFIDWILLLPPVLEQQLQERVATLTEGKNMEYISSWEQIALERGEIKGRVETILRQLRIKFGELSSEIEERLKAINDVERLDEIADGLIVADSLDDLALDDDPAEILLDG